MAIQQFNQISQYQHESIDDYTNRLKQASKDCGFSDDELNGRLCDQFIIGLRDVKIKLRMMEDDTHQLFTNICLKAIRCETLSKLDYTFNSTQQNVNHVSKTRFIKGSSASYNNKNILQNFDNNNNNTNRLKSNVCHRCGNDHRGQECKYKNFNCNRCKKIGHLERCCRSQVPSSPAQNNQSYNRQQNKQRHVNSIKAETHEEKPVRYVSIYRACSASPSASPPLSGSFNLNNNNVTMMIDTGAAVTILTERLF